MTNEKRISLSKLIGLYISEKSYKQKYFKKTELIIRERRVISLSFFLSALFISSESALIESHSLIFRSLSLNNYISVFSIYFYLYFSFSSYFD